MTRIRQAGKRMQTSLRGIANKARADKQHRFRNLYGLLNEEALLSSWPRVKKRAAGGVDHVSAQQYAEDLEGNVGRLVERLRRKSYRARLVRRRTIPKQGGRTRPLGIPAVEDKLLQIAVARILEAIYEQDFLPSSYGCRPGRGPQRAVSVVFAFQRRDEAQAFYRAVPARLAKFGLELAAEKSGILRFSRFHLGGKARSFEFLG